MTKSDKITMFLIIYLLSVISLEFFFLFLQHPIWYFMNCILCLIMMFGIFNSEE